MDFWLGPEVAEFVARHGSGITPSETFLQDPTGRLWALDDALFCWVSGDERYPCEDRALMETVLGPLVEIAIAV